MIPTVYLLKLCHWPTRSYQLWILSQRWQACFCFPFSLSGGAGGWLFWFSRLRAGVPGFWSAGHCHLFLINSSGMRYLKTGSSLHTLPDQARRCFLSVLCSSNFAFLICFFSQSLGKKTAGNSSLNLAGSSFWIIPASSTHLYSQVVHHLPREKYLPVSNLRAHSPLLALKLFLIPPGLLTTSPRSCCMEATSLTHTEILPEFPINNLFLVSESCVWVYLLDGLIAGYHLINKGHNKYLKSWIWKEMYDHQTFSYSWLFRLLF